MVLSIFLSCLVQSWQSCHSLILSLIASTTIWRRAESLEIKILLAKSAVKYALKVFQCHLRVFELHHLSLIKLLLGKCQLHI